MSRTLMVVTLIAFASAQPGTARGGASLASLVDRHLRPVVDEKKVVGMSVGIVRGDEVVAFGLGTVSKDGPRVPDGQTMYEIGSISKVMTGILLAEMVERGEVTLDEPVENLLPPEVRVPARGGKPITLLDLTTHHSGLPRLPSNLKGNPFDPYRGYSEADMYAFLSRHRLRRDPGARAAYSNLGVGLLGVAMARRAGYPEYEALMLDRLAGPLGMSETRIMLDNALTGRLAQGYGDFGLKAQPWEIRTLGGAGGIRSTVDDMCKFVQFCLKPDDSHLGRAVGVSLEPRRQFSGPNLKIGMGWLIEDGHTAFHNGQTGGYHAFIAVRPEQRVGLVVLCNSATDAVDGPAMKLLSALADPSQSTESR